MIEWFDDLTLGMRFKSGEVSVKLGRPFCRVGIAMNAFILRAVVAMERNIDRNLRMARRKRSEIAAPRAHEFVRAEYRSSHNPWGHRSLDVPIWIDGRSALIEARALGLNRPLGFGGNYLSMRSVWATARDLASYSAAIASSLRVNSGSPMPTARRRQFMARSRSFSLSSASFANRSLVISPAPLQRQPARWGAAGKSAVGRRPRSRRASAENVTPSGYRVTGDTNAPKAAEFLCPVADAAALPKPFALAGSFPLRLLLLASRCGFPHSL